ncbi:hypothetical protein QO010_002175 [Caulobacter ginsengisoli]|uniref:Uncharacterized protein n=1 Tax=Caulobacter ginsengisoli TaxID=400775 RepID=A0ABU0IQV5_9CAUL|nr:hypothetical protein [Caulobacter ginsengisoli]MDQ0464394.1 hypothetical protein [Caulobacter ginsengisoli]
MTTWAYRPRPSLATTSQPMVARTAAQPGNQAVLRRLSASAGAAPQQTKGAAEAPCPPFHSFPEDIYQAMEAAWKRTNHGGEEVTEHGGRIVSDWRGKRKIRTGVGESESIHLPEEKFGDDTLSTFHTHPYSKAKGAHLGVGFSSDDIKGFVLGQQGGADYVTAGSCNFALTVADPAKRDACQDVDFEKRFRPVFNTTSGGVQNAVNQGNKAAIAGCGLCYYQACRPDPNSPIPRVGVLI